MNHVTRLASARAPSAMGELRVARTDGQDRLVSYRMACSCGADVGRVISQFDPEERFWADPLVFQCADCARSATFFDSREHGYNAVLNGFSPYDARERDEPVRCLACGSERHEIVAEFRYEFEEEEVREDWSEAERQQMPDLFSSVGFVLTCSECGSSQRLDDFECA